MTKPAKVYRPNAPYLGVFRVLGKEVAVCLTQGQIDGWNLTPRPYSVSVNFSHIIRAVLKNQGVNVSPGWVVQDHDLIRIEKRF